MTVKELREALAGEDDSKEVLIDVNSGFGCSLEIPAKLESDADSVRLLLILV